MTRDDGIFFGNVDYIRNVQVRNDWDVFNFHEYLETVFHEEEFFVNCDGQFGVDDFTEDGIQRHLGLVLYACIFHTFPV